METDDSRPMTNEEWERRRLCPDGGCIGVIGPDNRCRECGAVSDEPPPAGIAAGAEKDDAPKEPVEKNRDGETEAGAASDPEKGLEAPEDLDWENRCLCPDGHCIGVIGPDGRCRECGKEEGDATV
ncbi:conserved hypothetical protein [Candidatus Desulfarcum epimagneticum]|uniref:Uncharacterized protein n=1 Tax=uncultured Desulfobacteraceae bacterium TaxID=218296 RepID=A0A484HDT8_9BACT|nr:conserved hypothetical protein [uncultured Desulfobacteraceae bacterium]